MMKLSVSMASRSKGTLTDRLRIFYIGTILSAWLFVSDGLNFSLNWNDGSSAAWAKFLCLFTGYFFCIFTFIGCVLLLLWCKVTIGCVLVGLSSLMFGSLRLIAVLLGFKDFLKETSLDSTTSGASDVAIAALQLYLAVEACRMYYIHREEDVKGYIAIDNTLDEEDHEDMDGVEETTGMDSLDAGKTNPFGDSESRVGSAYDNSYQHETGRMSAYD